MALSNKTSALSRLFRREPSPLGQPAATAPEIPAPAPRPSPLDAVKTLLARRAPTQLSTDPYVAERENDIISGYDALTPDVDSAELTMAQNEIAGETDWAPSRGALKSDLVGRLRQRVGLDEREHQQRLEENRAKEEGLNLRARIMAQGQSRPYYQITQSAQGPQVFDARTGQLRDAGIDNKPSDTTADFLANTQQILRDFDTVERNFDPRMVGPIAGRWNTLSQALVGGDPTLTEMYTAASRIGNQLLKIRSGSQVTDGEMTRLANELMDRNQPPSVFLGRLSSARAAVENIYRDRASLSFGRTSSGDVDRMTTQQAPTAPVGDARAKATELINRYRR